MTTLRQLERAAKKSFVRQMNDRGFDYHRNLEFSRTTPAGVIQLVSGGVSYGANLTFSVTCVVPEFRQDILDDFPSNVPMTCGGGLGEGLLTAELWDVENLDEERLEHVLDEVLAEIDAHAIPWFESVMTREQYVRAMFPHLRKRAENDGRLEAIRGM